MVNYQNGKIYKLVSNHTDKVYYGSTTQSLALRKGQHKDNYKRWKNGKSNYVTSFELFKLGDVEIVLVENCPCDTKEELHARERYYIEHDECLNKIVPTRTSKEWYRDNPEYNRQYYKANKDKIIQKVKTYMETNKDKIKQKKQEYYESNKERITQKRKDHYGANKEEINAQRSVKITCDCGSTVRKADLVRHRRTKKHQKYVESLDKI